MPILTLQEYFNIAWERAKTPVKAQLPETGQCRYRVDDDPNNTSDENCCFIGKAISPSDYDPGMENSIACDALGIDSTLPFARQLAELQTIHDNAHPEIWEGALQQFAKYYNLTIPA